MMRDPFLLAAIKEARAGLAEGGGDSDRFGVGLEKPDHVSP